MSPNVGRRATGLAAVAVAVVLALVACTPGRPRIDPTTTPTTAPPAATPSTCTAAPEDSVASFAPGGITAEAARAQTIHPDRLVVGVSADTNLVGSRDASGDLVGFDVDIAREIAQRLFGSRDAIELRALTVPQRIPALRNGEVDLVANSLTVTCARWEQINFSTEYLRAGQRLLVRVDDAAAGVDTLEELAGKRVCVSRGGTGADNLKQRHPAITPVEVADRGECLVRFQQGTVDAILNGDNLLAGFVPQDRYSARIVGKQLIAEPTAIGVKKEHVELTRYVNQALEDIRRTSWTDTYNRWLATDLGPPPPGFAPPPADHSRTP